MKQFVVVIVLGAALFMGGAYSLGLLDDYFPRNPDGPKEQQPQKKGSVVTAEDKLGDFLYEPAKFPPIPAGLRRDPVTFAATMNPLEQEEVASEVNGKIIFIGDQVDDAAVLVAGSAPFLAEPYAFSVVEVGREKKFYKFFRRVYEGDTIAQGQMLAMIQPAEAIGGVLEEIAKINAAKADFDAAKAGEQEGWVRERRAYGLKLIKAIGEEEYATAKLTAIKLSAERVSKGEAVKVSEVKKEQADIKLQACEIKPQMQYPHSTIKSIIKQRGFVVKAGDPVMVVQNLDRLLCEALVGEQYFAYLKRLKNLTATIEPTVLEKPLHEYPAHTGDITSIAVSKDLKIVSGSEDRTVCITSQEDDLTLATLKHADAIRAVACTPVGAEKNLILSGCANGNIHLWELPAYEKGKEYEPKQLRMIPPDKAHGADAAITAVAFSPDGKYFATGASDGTIRLWTTEVAKEGQDTEYAVERYAFIPANGVQHCHDDAVTSLSFTPQSRLVSAARDKTLRVWRLRDKGAVLERDPIRDRVGNVTQLGVTQDGKWMVFDQGRTLKMFSIETQRFTHTLNVPAGSTPFDTVAVFSPDSTLMLTAGGPDGRLQLWRTPDANTRFFEVRQFAPQDKLSVTCAAFSPEVKDSTIRPFAVSASGNKIHQWELPTKAEVDRHPIRNVRMTTLNQNLDAGKNGRIGFEIDNKDGRYEAGRPATIVIE